MPQPFLLLIAGNLALAGILGWKWSLRPVPTWLAILRSKAIFLLTLYDSKNWFEILLKCLHYTSAVPQPFMLLIAANLALTGLLGWKWSLWPVLAWVEVQRSRAFFSWTYMLVSMIWNTPELSALQHSHDTAIFVVDCCQFGPSWMFPVWFFIFYFIELLEVAPIK